MVVINPPPTTVYPLRVIFLFCDVVDGVIFDDEKITINDKDCCIDDVIDIFKKQERG